jgi:hypothetical protein
MNGGSVVMETLAPPRAILHQVEYPEPFTAAEIEEFRKDHPKTEFLEFHEEREYLLDRRHLGPVGVLTRYRESEKPRRVTPIRAI